MNTAAKCILLDIEGTTTPIDFVYQVLFPFARTHVKDYLARHWSSADVQNDLAQLRAEQEADTQQCLAPPAISEGSDQSTLETTVAYVHWLMDRDRKSTPLKSLQGKIWEEGYQAGKLLSQVFDDVPPAMKHWHDEGKRICIYSSGSVLAQKLLFAHTTVGNLTPLVSDYFDTTVGTKVEAGSYRHIAANLQLRPEEIVFVSDVIAELDAARAAGLQGVLSLRPGNHPQSPSDSYQIIHSFAELIS
ncbi:MAG: acireductone synthase [Acidobacteriota bacterium]